MIIDLKDSKSFTLESVKELIASRDDTKNCQLRVSNSGIAYLSDDYGNQNLHDVRFRFETWVAGNGYCGLNAANDKNWVEEVYKDLKENWPNPKDSFIDW